MVIMIKLPAIGFTDFGRVSKMANMYPNNIENYNYTQSEKVFYNILKNKLSDKFTVFYSVTWYTEENNIRVNSECDFLIFHPSYGYITVEVKGGSYLKKINEEWRLYDNSNIEGYRVLKRSPFKQAEESMHYFKKYYEEQFGYFYKGIYGFAVAFPFYCVEDDLGPEAPKKLIIDFSDMDLIEKKIFEIFDYWKGQNHNFISFSSEQQVQFLNMVNKRISISAAAGSLIEIREKQLNEINRVQDNYLDFIANYRQAFIVGGAGTGKTWMAIKKAKIEASKGYKVLFLCYNSALLEYIKNILLPLGVDCYTFYSVVHKIVGFNNYMKLINNSKELKGVSDYFDKCYNLPQYDTILIDESQDFTEEWAYCVRSLLKDEKMSYLYVFYDENQNIFGRDFGNAFMIDTPYFILKENLRNTSAIYKWIVNKTGLGAEEIPNTIEGVEPERISFKSNKTARKKIEDILRNLIKKEKVNNKSIVILSNRTLEKSIFRGKQELGEFKFIIDNNIFNNNDIMYRTIQSYKGLESDVVIYINHKDNRDIDINLQYVAFTRARFYLYVIDVEQAIE